MKTRDQDSWTLKGKGATAEDALDELRAMLNEVEGDLGQRVRDFDPERGAMDPQRSDTTDDLGDFDPDE